MGFYDNVQCKRQGNDKDEFPQPTQKAEVPGRKVMLCIISAEYYSFWVFKSQSKTQCRLMLSKAAMCAWKSKKNTFHSSIGETQCAFSWQCKATF